jgi:PAS domain S-box-containing protein
MNAVDRSQLLEVLSRRRDEIADDWYKAVAQVSYIPLEASKVRRRLVELVEQASAVLVADSFESSQAHAIGVALAQLHCIQPEALEGILEALAHRPVQGLPMDQAAALQPRLAALVGAVAAGFLRQAREMVLVEQEQIQGALMAELGQAIEALRTSEERFRTIVETAPGFLLITDTEGRTTYASPNCEEMTGITQEELQSELIWWVHEDDLPKAQEIVNRVFREGEAGRNFEYKAIKRGGTIWYASSSWEPFRDEQGTLKGVVLQTIDITERRQAEEALQESEEKFRNLAEQSPNMIFINKKGRVVYANERCEKVTGYTRDEFYSADFSFLTLTVPEHRELVEARFSKHMRGEELEPYDYTLVAKDGMRVEAMVITKLIDYAGEKAILGTVVDITERKQAEEALKNSEGKWRSLVENAHEWVVTLTRDGTILSINRTTPGRSVEETIGTSIYDLLSPDEQDGLSQALESAFQSGELENYESLVVGADGAKAWHSNNVIPVKRDGRTVAAVFVARDITERKRAERQALRAERMAAMGRLATSLAHEINNPLQAMRSNLELALDFDLEQEEQRNYLDVVRQEVERLARITRRVLDFAHPAEDTRYPVSITHLIQKMRELIGKQLELAHVEVTIDLPVDLPTIFAAPDQIIQVLLNLSVNAIEAMPDGGNLHITARVDGDVVVLTLMNDGPPLPAEYIERIFDPFFTTKPAGTGLGLSVSHSIIRYHDGTINVENLEGDQGVAFTVTLPVAHSAKQKGTLA